MEKLEFKIDINASKQKVWDTMFNPDTYKKWVNVSWPGAYFDGVWKQGADMKFLSPSEGGTLANLAEYKPYEFLLAKHIAVINWDGIADYDSDIAKGWVGTTESYRFTEHNHKTEVKVVVHTKPDWASMFSDGWPNALAELKKLSEA